MRYLLANASRRVVARLAAEKTLCAFDFDGTLAPIVTQPARARMRAQTRRLLARLATLYPCVVISGRGLDDLSGRLAGVELARAIGNHGAEVEGRAPKARPEVRQWLAALENALGCVDGVWVEDKGYSVAVHYRRAVHKTEARRAILAAAQPLQQVRIFGGKQVVNLVPAGGPHKGDALAAERGRLGCDWILYVGDDDTDEDAFALDGDIVGVRIGRKAGSRAGYYLRDQREIDKLIEAMILLRRGSVR